MLQGQDSENSTWLLDCDLHSNSLRFPFYLHDIDKIPRNHLRLGKYCHSPTLVNHSKTHGLLWIKHNIQQNAAS